MEVTMETIKKLQQIELKMLEMFVHICEEEDLQYYLLGGTLLGAVRHKGFIPWDDDIDVGMPRGDYERFLLCAPKYLPEPYFLQTYKTDKEYPFPYAKIRKTNTVYKETALSNLKMNHGVWIDIFPLDFYSIFPFWFSVKFRLLEKRTHCRFVMKTTLKQKFYQLLSYIYCPSWHKSVERRDELMRSDWKNIALAANFCGAWGSKEVVPTEWYDDGATLEFEHLLVKGPAQYHKWLTQVYGDYMKLPPIEKRMVRHNPAEIKL